MGAGPAEACNATYPEGTELTLVPEAALGSEFIRFSGDCEEETCELTMEEAHSVTVVFGLEPSIPEYAFTLKIKGSGSGSARLCEAQEGPEPCQAKYPEGTELLLHPSADSDSVFAGFSGGGCKGLSCEVIMEAPRSVSATFNLIPSEFEYLLAVERIGTGSGSVTSDPAGIDCGSDCSETFSEGTKVTLTATPAQGSVFDHWSGGGCAGAGTCTATMSTNRTVKAVFTAVGQRTLTVSKTGTGSRDRDQLPGRHRLRLGLRGELRRRRQGHPDRDRRDRLQVRRLLRRLHRHRRLQSDHGRGPKCHRRLRERSRRGVAIAAATAKVKGGKALLRLSCTGAAACKGEPEAPRPDRIREEKRDDRHGFLRRRFRRLEDVSDRPEPQGKAGTARQCQGPVGRG